MRLLLVEDDTLLGDGIVAGLSQDGYTVDWFTDGNDAEAALASEAYELLVLDINLPGQSGLSVLRKLRAAGSDLAVLVLTARDTVADRVAGLDAGADDYLVKPFDLDELEARLRALLRRRHGRSDPVLTHRSICLDPASHSVTLEGKPVILPKREFSLIRLLLENEGRVLSRQRIEENIYGWNDDVESNAIEVHISHLRKKFGADLIRTLRGVGYTIDKPE